MGRKGLIAIFLYSYAAFDRISTDTSHSLSEIAERLI